MSSQRMIGVVCTALSFAVVLQYSLMGNFDEFTLFCAGVLVVCAISIAWESVFMKATQVITMMIIGAVLQFHGEASAYIGVAIIAGACNLSFSYGLMDSHSLIKGIGGGAALIGLLAMTPYGSLRITIMRSIMAASLIAVSWIAGRERVIKARKAAALQTEHLERVLKSTLEAAKILADEITRRKANGGK